VKPNDVFPQKEEEYTTKYSFKKKIAKFRTKNNGYYQLTEQLKEN